MIEKIINSMIYGNIKTKIFLWSVLVFAITAFIMLLIGIATGAPMLGLGGFGVGLFDLILSQSVSLNELSKEKKKKEKTNSQKENGEKSSQGKKTEDEMLEDDEKKKKEKERAKVQYLSGMDAKKLKKIMKEHKVNQIHVKVMIDSFPKKKIEQVPAFMWKTDTMLHFMLLAGKSEEFEVPLEDIKGILLVKNVPVNKEKDYAFYKYASFISKMFKPYLPEYHEGTKDGQLEITKNTFRIEPGIYLTNTSVANLRKVLLPGVAFLVDDKVIASRQFNEYFKELYRYSLLCKNMIIDLEEYKEKVEQILDALLDAPITGTEFVSTIRDLNKYHLITREYVVEYTQKYREMKMPKNK